MLRAGWASSNPNPNPNPLTLTLTLTLTLGGLGERLGYSGIKLELPPEMLTGTPYLQLYAEHVLALQREQRRLDPSSPLLPLILMTSDDTDLPTRALIARLGGLGLDPSQLHVLRQEKVP